MSPASECVLCRRILYGFGNNPWPLADHGQCCDECNAKVIEARLSKAFGYREGSE